MENKNEKILDVFRASAQKMESETVAARDGGEIEILFFEHASLCFVWNGVTVYVDPLNEYADYAKFPKADVILVTHEHYDHLDTAAVAALRTPQTVVIGSANVAAEVAGTLVIPHFEQREIAPGVGVESVPAYNVSPDQLQFHPRERGDNGYVVTLGGSRIYVAGDTEPIPEMAELKGIDIMFLPVNQPYTMKPRQAAEAARTIGAPLFFPYHTTDTDTGQILHELADTPSIEVRIYHMP